MILNKVISFIFCHKHNINAIRIRKNSHVTKKYNPNLKKMIEFIKRQDDIYHKQFLPHVHGRKLIIIDDSDAYDSLDYEDKKYIGGLHYNSSQLLKLNKKNYGKERVICSISLLHVIIVRKSTLLTI